MKTISGLLLKDLYVFKSYRKNIIFSIIVFAVMIGLIAIRTNAMLTGTIMFLIVFGMNSISSFSYDEMADAEKYLLALPISRKEMVQSKYLFAFLNSFLSMFIGFLVSVVVSYVATGKVPLTLAYFSNCIYFFTSVTFLICTDIPCIYKWGVEKGRMQAVIAPVFIVMFLGILLVLVFFMFPTLFTLDNLNLAYKMLPIICVLLDILMYVISYGLSCKIFFNKDL